ncbi:MAG: LacI family DNA-binding transcriptional regulator [bacterium]|jgi:DNA-binding LacI/PurR family transcriptional regulator|nr:LacI family transcriptional regulator [Planctomycetota bacterium]HIL53081.1 LacI family transcriptional regulator [Planctomycetota bacterium]
MSATQFDIAKEAQVSQATVSRVLSGDEKVDGVLRLRVQRVLEEKNYHVNAHARGLRRRASGQIGLVLKRPSGGLQDDPFVALLISSMTEVLGRASYSLCVDLASSTEEQAAILERMLRSDRVDGVVLLEPEMHDERFTRLCEDDFPFVVIGDPGRVAAPSVDYDNVRAGYLAGQHLIEAGCERVGMIAGPPRVRFSENRIAGYSAALRDAGQEPTVWHSPFGLRAARQVAGEGFDSSDRCDGLVVLDDVMAVGAAGAAIERGLRPGRDLALVGFNNSGFCDLVEGGLSSIDLDMETMIRCATDELLSIVRKRSRWNTRRRVIPCRLVQRGSSRLGGCL